MKTRNRILLLLFLLCCAALPNLPLHAAPHPGVLRFDFGSGPAPEGWTRVIPTNLYSRERGFGFETSTPITSIDRQSEDLLSRDFCTSDRPFFFSVALPEGNYRIRITMGDPAGSSTNTVKAELRRLMLHSAVTRPGESLVRTIIVNVRQPRIRDGREVRLKERERTSEWHAWDEKLTLEFNGARPCIAALEIEPANDLPTLFLLGDSTVCDQPLEPWNSWGQMLPVFFKPTIAVANHAESGETLRSSLGAGRLDKVLSLMKPGDYLLIQFGHNDMKDRADNALAVYKENLALFITRTREKGGHPVLVTSMERKAGVTEPTLAGYPNAVREVAVQLNVPLVDLNAMSRTLYRALGDQLDAAFQDGTHHNNYGSFLLAKCVIQGLKDANLPLAQHVVDEWTPFRPENPDPLDHFDIPSSPEYTEQRPLGD
ncbi:MAG TPA: rhamnogalacturonan acetylesterase [Verrucomicrobia bacterium]|nr:rhamnogalacturonan acetylesterase [Verrucomicrobiota bacterium]HOP96061.1 rhamnogalacturonan acetylesterase [Verrucomicrobiota bacterium]HPU54768.1 rhamnogalacturonan acetylesterase [Verrucomicrobiota bacterium]